MGQTCVLEPMRPDITGVPIWTDDVSVQIDAAAVNIKATEGQIDRYVVYKNYSVGSSSYLNLDQSFTFSYLNPGTEYTLEFYGLTNRCRVESRLPTTTIVCTGL